MLAGLILFPLAQAPAVLRGYAEIAAAAPDELTVMTGFLSAGGQMLLFLFPAWSGDPARGQDAITALQQLGTPVMAQVAPMPYPDALGMFDQSVVNGRHYALATRWLPASPTTPPRRSPPPPPAPPRRCPRSRSTTSTAPRHESPPPTLLSRCAATTCWSRSSPPGNHPPTPTQPSHRAWADSLCGQLAPSSLPGGYPNLLGPAEPDRIPPRLRPQRPPAPGPQAPLRPRRRIQHRHWHPERRALTTAEQHPRPGHHPGGPHTNPVSLSTAVMTGAKTRPAHN